MTYQTLTAVHRADRAARHILGAADFARRHEAHLDVLVAAALPQVPTLDLVRADPSGRTVSYARLVDDLDQLADELRATLDDEDVTHSVKTICEPLSRLDDAIGHDALACDLVLLEEPASLLGGIGARALGGALMRAGKPVLVLRDGTRDTTASIAETRTALIAWHASPESARAVQQALPLLAEASSIRLLQIGDLDDAALDARQTAVDLWLTRHGIDIACERLAPGRETVAAALAERLRDPEVDLAVMGAYGHSPLLESWFAGNTYAVLSAAPTNLFLAH